MITKDEKTENYFNDYVPEYNIEKLDYTIEFIKENFNDNLSLLDIGCGTGNVLEKIQIETGIKNICGMDVAPNYLELIKKRLNCDTILGSILDEQLTNNHQEKYDFIIISEVLHHLIGRNRRESFELVKMAIKNASSILKPNGYLIICEPTFKPTISSDILFYIKKFFSSFTKGRIECFGKETNIGEPMVSFLSEKQLSQFILSNKNIKIIAKNIKKTSFPFALRFILVFGRQCSTFIIKKNDTV